MRKLTIFSAVFSLFLLVPASITCAQTITHEKGLTCISFDFPQGKISVWLPDDIRPGDMISGSFKVEPAPGNAKQQQRSIEELLKKELKVGNPADPAIVGKALLKRYQEDARGGSVSKESVGLPFVVSLTGTDRKTQSVQVELNPPSNTAPDHSAGCDIPTHALTGYPIIVRGNFDGDASNTKCRIDGKELPLIAESPRKSIFQLPADQKGIQTIQVTEADKKSCERKVSMVDLKVSAPRTNLRKGEKTMINVAITGLQGLPDTAVLTLDNRTRSTVQLKPADHQVIGLFPDSLRGGTFSRSFDVQSISTGNFNININLDLPEPGNTNQYNIFCNDKCSPVGKETDPEVGEVGISSSTTSSPDDEDKAFKTAKWVVNNGDLFGATGNEDAALDALVKIGRTRGYVVWVKACWKRCEKGWLCNDWERYCGPWIPVVWVDGLENTGDNTFKATGGHTTDHEGKVEGLTRKEIMDLAIKKGNELIKKK